MEFSRLSPTQIVVAAPLEWAREAAWHALWQSGMGLPTIDPHKNVVCATSGDGVLAAARLQTARFEAQNSGTLVSFESKPVLGGTIDFGAGRRQAQKVADALERIVRANAPWTPDNTAVAPQSAPAAPIAAPTASAPVAPIAAPVARPLYGEVRASKRGVPLLIYAFVLSLLCSIASPLVLVYGFQALRQYREEGDPGDKPLVIAAMILSSVISLLVVGLFALVLWTSAR